MAFVVGELLTCKLNEEQYDDNNGKESTTFVI